MSWVVDEFWVKPSGALSSKRYVRILVDENGTISREDVPGKGSINLPNISDYKSNNRRYTENDIITDFCNFTTFTRYTVRAQNSDPFAYVAAPGFNDPTCGYLEPLPTPAVPPNPFGNPVYGLYKTFDFCDVQSNPISVEIERKNFVGTVTQIEAGEASPVKISYKTKEDNKFEPIRACTCDLHFISDTNFALSEFYTEDQREFRVSVYRNGNLEFRGFIIPDNCQESFEAPPYGIRITATDGLGELKKVTYPLPIGSNVQQSFKDVLCYALAATNLELDLHTICNLYESKMANGLNDDPLAQATVNPSRMTNGGTIFNCYEVIENVCKLFGAYIAQIKGGWYFVRVNELSDAVIRKRVYSYTGLFLRGENVVNGRQADNLTDTFLVNAGHVLSIGNAYKRVVVNLKYGSTPSLFLNGDFEDWDGQNFRHWTKIGGIKISRAQRTVTGNGGAQIPINDYALQFDEPAVVNKWIENRPVGVERGDKIKLSYSVGRTDTTTLVFQLQTAYVLKMLIKVGNYCLYNEPGTTDYRWVKQVGTLEIVVSNPTGDHSTYINNLDMPEVPETGAMYIQIYGFIRIEEEWYEHITNPAFPWATDRRKRWKEVTAYTPVSIDDVSISKNTKDDPKVIDGSFNVSEQLGFYTQTPDEIELIFGDYEDQSSADIPNDRYAIKTSDGSYSTLWYSYSSAATKLPIALFLSREILKAYQKPFRYLEGEFQGDNLSYLDAFNVIVPCDAGFTALTFMQSSVDLDLKEMTMSATWVEIFSKPVNAQSVNVPHVPGQVPPAFTQNPNNPTKVAGIFDEEFTTEFA